MGFAINREKTRLHPLQQRVSGGGAQLSLSDTTWTRSADKAAEGQRGSRQQLILLCHRGSRGGLCDPERDKWRLVSVPHLCCDKHLSRGVPGAFVGGRSSTSFVITITDASLPGLRNRRHMAATRIESLLFMGSQFTAKSSREIYRNMLIR